jgi:hypothetical protein
MADLVGHSSFTEGELSATCIRYQCALTASCQSKNEKALINMGDSVVSLLNFLYRLDQLQSTWLSLGHLYLVKK